MKKHIIKYIIALFLFISMFFTNSVKTTADPGTGAGRVCANVTLYHCIWMNDDGTVDFWTFGIWVTPE